MIQQFHCYVYSFPIEVHVCINQETHTRMFKDVHCSQLTAIHNIIIVAKKKNWKISEYPLTIEYKTHLLHNEIITLIKRNKVQIQFRHNMDKLT